MKKLFSLAFIAAIISQSAYAQRVISNDYGSNPQSDSNTTVTKIKETTSQAGLMFYNFEGDKNYGWFINVATSSGFGGEFAMRGNWKVGSSKDVGQFNFDLGLKLLNYEFYRNNDISLDFSLSLGPTVYYATYSIETVRPNPKYPDHTITDTKDYSDLYIDGFINPRITLSYKSFFVTGGYFLEARKFDFGKKEKRADCFNIGIGFNIW